MLDDTNPFYIKSINLMLDWLYENYMLLNIKNVSLNKKELLKFKEY